MLYSPVYTFAPPDHVAPLLALEDIMLLFVTETMETTFNCSPQMVVYMYKWRLYIHSIDMS